MVIEARFSINVLENHNSELLLLKRSPELKLGPGLWGFPAGHIEQDESPDECSIRELQEEIGPDARIELVKHLGPLPDSHYGGIYRIYLYHYIWQGGTVTLNHEHTEHAWIKREDFRNYDVMDGIDEDILYLDIWPREFLNRDKLP